MPVPFREPCSVVDPSRHVSPLFALLPSLSPAVPLIRSPLGLASGQMAGRIAHCLLVEEARWHLM